MRDRRRVTRSLVAALTATVLVACQPSWPSGLELPAPEQGPVPEGAPERFMHRGNVVQPVAGYTIEGLVLSKMRYRFDKGSSISPVDLALGWGSMAKAEVLGRLRVRQNDRFYFWSAEGSLPVPREDITQSSANVHLVFGSAEVEDVVDDVDPGEVIRLEGVLVNVTAPDGFEMRSSTVRDDTGGGACEVMWVDFAELTDT
jgi:hypothetical protein